MSLSTKFSILINNGKNDEELISLIEKFKDLCKIYKKENFNENLLIQELQNIIKYLHDSVKSKEYKILIKEKFYHSVVEILRMAMENDDWSFLNLISSTLINVTYKSEVQYKVLSEIGFAELLIDIFLKVNENELNSKKIILINILILIYNVACHDEIQQCFQQHKEIDQFKNIVEPLSFDKDRKVSIISTFVLMWFVKENQEVKKILEDHCDIIRNVFILIDGALLNPEMIYEGWSILELLLGLQALSTIDISESLLSVMEELMSTLINIITIKPLMEKEVELSLRILWNLSFIENNSNLIKRKYDIEKVVEPLLHNNIKSIRHNTKGLIWCINKKSSIGRNSFKYDIFLSYSHVEKEIVMKIEKQLKKQYTVWIDKDNIKGSGLDDMALGIERSRIFIMCISNSYKQSQNCRSEANYAYRIKRPIIPLLMEYKFKPDGWLGIISSSELYIDFSDNTKISESILLLLSAISYKMKMYKRTEMLKRSNSINEIARKSKIEKKNISRIKEWNPNKVSQWLSSNDLSHVQSKFDQFDGEMINAMRKMKDEAPNLYYESLDKKLQLTFPEILKLSSALSKLKL